MKDPRRLTKIYGRDVYLIKSPIPLVGHVAFGIIDRGTNVLQVRPSTLCFHSCIYCSVDSGPQSKWRTSEFLVDREWLVRWIEEMIKIKGVKVEILLDGVGEPLTHPEIIKLIKDISKINNVKCIALETHGGSLSKKLVERLSNAGLNRINLSIDTLDREKARILTGSKWYDVRKIINIVEWAYENTNLDFVLTPVIVPGINENDIEELIEFAKQLRLGNKIGWPSAVLVQKLETHKYGRKIDHVEEWNWRRFYKWLKYLESKTHYRLILRPEEIGIRKAKGLPKPFKLGERVPLIIVEKGWLKGEFLAVDKNYRRTITLIDTSKKASKGKIVLGKIIRNKDNIFLAKR